MSHSVKKVLSKTFQQIDLLDDDKTIAFTRDMAGFKGLVKAFFGGLTIQDFKTIVKGKKLISMQEKDTSDHH